jgi:hypothetical protein
VYTEGTFIGFHPRREAMYKRINEFATTLPDGYKGSRSILDRFMWKKTSQAFFIEVKKKPEALASLFYDVAGIRATVNMINSVLVFSRLFPDEAGFRFLVSDKNHIRGEENLPETFSVCFTRQPDNDRALEAWRILREAVQGMEVHKEMVDRLDIELKNALGPGSASSTVCLKPYKRPPLPPLPHRESLEYNLVRDIAGAYTLKIDENKKFERARHRGMLEAPSDLALKAGLILFRNESDQDYIKHKDLQANPEKYESSAGHVYCDAGNGIYARIVDQRIGEVCKHNPNVERLCTDKAKGDLIEVVLYQYRRNQDIALSHLQRLIIDELEITHGPTGKEPEDSEEGEQDSDDEQSEQLDLQSNVDYDPDDAPVISEPEESNHTKDDWDAANEDEARSFEEEQCRNFTDDMKDHSLMMEFKNRGPAGSVRWRALPFKQGNDFMQNSMQVMIKHLDRRLHSLWDWLWHAANFSAVDDDSGQALPTCVPHAACKAFLEKARKGSLDAILSWSQDPEILEHKEHFFSALPLRTMEKFKDFITDACESRHKAVTKLLNLHNGEVVEVPNAITNRWTLVYVNDGISGFEDLHQQLEKGPNYRVPTLNTNDRNNIRMSIVKTLLQLKNLGRHDPKSKIGKNDLEPKWEKQWNRLCVPCTGTTKFVWLRSGVVTTLGELFEKLHHKYTCREIYVLYLHLDIVSVKRKIVPPKGTKRTYNKTW